MVTEGEPLERLSEHPLRSITLRIQEETYQKLIAIAGEKSKSEYIRELLVEHLKEPQEKLKSTSREAQGVLEAKIDSLEAIIKAKDQTIKILEEDKGFVILEYTGVIAVLVSYMQLYKLLILHRYAETYFSDKFCKAFQNLSFFY